jgi:murein DD-endopeptidase MepM/ murein hydrolase activator NlpD
MAESHILLLPKTDYIKWVKAARTYILKFGVNTTPDPIKAGQKENITIAVALNGYPEQNNQIADWLRARFPNARIDEIEVNDDGHLGLILDARANAGLRYGLPPSIDPQVPPVTSPTTPDDGEFKIYWPTEIVHISQRFGANPQIYNQWGLPGHEGLDMRAPMNTEVRAGFGGIVFNVVTDPNLHPYGKHIRIRHDGGYRTVYAHLAQTLVKEGDVVEAKQLIGRADSTGNSTGSHLHLTLKKEGATARKETVFKGDVIDPEPFLVYPD